VRDGAVSVGDGSAPCTRQEQSFHKRLTEDALLANEQLKIKSMLAEEAWRALSRYEFILSRHM
jgi:hypothetical protein